MTELEEETAKFLEEHPNPHEWAKGVSMKFIEKASELKSELDSESAVKEEGR